MTEPKTSTVNRVRTPHDDVVDGWWVGWVGDELYPADRIRAEVLRALAKQPEAVQRGVLRKARGQ